MEDKFKTRWECLRALRGGEDIGSVRFEAFIGDFRVGLAALRWGGHGFDLLSKELRGNKRLVLEAVSRNGFSLQFASDECRDDKEIVMAAVTEAGTALRYASERLRDDAEVVRKAVAGSYWAIGYVSERERKNPELLLQFFIGCVAGKDSKLTTFSHSLLLDEIKGSDMSMEFYNGLADRFGIKSLYALFSKSDKEKVEVLVEHMKRDKLNSYCLPKHLGANKQLVLRVMGQLSQFDATELLYRWVSDDIKELFKYEDTKLELMKVIMEEKAAEQKVSLEDSLGVKSKVCKGKSIKL